MLAGGVKLLQQKSSSEQVSSSFPLSSSLEKLSAPPGSPAGITGFYGAQEESEPGFLVNS